MSRDTLLLLLQTKPNPEQLKSLFIDNPCALSCFDSGLKDHKSIPGCILLERKLLIMACAPYLPGGELPSTLAFLCHSHNRFFSVVCASDVGSLRHADYSQRSVHPFLNGDCNHHNYCEGQGIIR